MILVACSVSVGVVGQESDVIMSVASHMPQGQDLSQINTLRSHSAAFPYWG